MQSIQTIARTIQDMKFSDKKITCFSNCSERIFPTCHNSFLITTAAILVKMCFHGTTASIHQLSLDTKHDTVLLISVVSFVGVAFLLLHARSIVQYPTPFVSSVCHSCRYKVFSAIWSTLPCGKKGTMTCSKNRAGLLIRVPYCLCCPTLCNCKP